MTLWLEATEFGSIGDQYFQLVLTDDGVTGLLLAGCSPAVWRSAWARGGWSGVEPGVALSRLAKHYRRLGAAAVIGESTSNFVLRWDEVHEVRVDGDRPEVAIRLTARTWLGFRRRRVFLVELADGGDASHVAAELERELYGRVTVRRV